MVLRQDLENTVYSELGGRRRAVGVYVRSRSTTLYLLPVTAERRQLAISSSLKSHALLWSKGKNIFGFPFPERRLHKHCDRGRSNGSCEGEM